MSACLGLPKSCLRVDGWMPAEHRKNLRTTRIGAPGGCVTQTALADTGIEGSSSSTGLMALALGALVAGAAALVLTMRPRGNHS